MSKNKKTKRQRYLTLIQKTREAMRSQIRCVIGCDDFGYFHVITGKKQW